MLNLKELLEKKQLEDQIFGSSFVTDGEDQDQLLFRLNTLTLKELGIETDTPHIGEPSGSDP